MGFILFNEVIISTLLIKLIAMKRAIKYPLLGVIALSLLFFGAQNAKAAVNDDHDLQSLTVSKFYHVANNQDIQTATMVVQTSNPSDLTWAAIIPNYTRGLGNYRGYFRWTDAGGFEEAGGNYWGNNHVILQTSGLNASERIVDSVNGTITFIFRWTAAQTYGETADVDITYNFGNHYTKQYVGSNEVNTSYSVSLQAPVLEHTFQSLVVDKNFHIYDNSDVQTATLVVNTNDVADLNWAGIVPNYTRGLGNYRGNFHWNSVNGFFEHGGAYWGNQHVILQTSGPNASERIVDSVNRTVTFIFRWVAAPTYGEVPDVDITYNFGNRVTKKYVGNNEVNTSFVVGSPTVVCPVLSAGDLFRVSGNRMVYIVNSSQNRMYFYNINNNDDIFFTWYENYSNVPEIPVQCVSNYLTRIEVPFGINYRPGSRLVKLAISPDIYAVLPGNTLAKIGVEGSEELVIEALYGQNWRNVLVEIPDVIWGNYVNRDQDIRTAVPHDGMLVRTNSMPSGVVYYVSQGYYYLVNGQLPPVLAQAVETVSDSVFNTRSITNGTIIPGLILEDPTQLSYLRETVLRVTTLNNFFPTQVTPGTNDFLLAKVLLDGSGSAEDVIVTQLKIRDSLNSLARGLDINNLRLFVDRDGDSYNGVGTPVPLSSTVSGVNSVPGVVEDFIFNLSGPDQFVVKQDKKLVVEVRGDIYSGATPNGVHQLSVNLSDYVSAVGVSSGVSVNETVESLFGNHILITSRGGEVMVGVDSGNAVPRLFAGGTTGVNLGSFNFLATVGGAENVQINSILLTMNETNPRLASFADYDLLYLEDEVGNVLGSTIPSSATPTINFGSGSFVVDRNDTDGQIVYLKANLSQIGLGYNVQVGGHRLGFSLTDPASVQAIGQQTGLTSMVDFSAGQQSPSLNNHHLYKSTVAVTKLALSNNTVSNGSNDLYKFRVSANRASAGLYKTTFDVSSIGVQIGNFELYDVTNSNEVLLGTINVLSVDGILEFYMDTNGDGIRDEVFVAPSTARTLVLRASITGASAGDAVFTRLHGDASEYDKGTTIMGSAVEADTHADNDFIWSDRSVGAHGIGTNDWTNGYLVSGLNSRFSTPAVLSL